jgi:hypothetical protein
MDGGNPRRRDAHSVSGESARRAKCLADRFGRHTASTCDFLRRRLAAEILFKA